VKALLLFLTIEGNLTSLDENTVYIWPQNACNIGYSKWVSGRSVVFLDRDGDWNKLGHKSDLGIQEISAEDLYINYIFPVFSLLNEDERYTHPKHIRECLFDTNNFIRHTDSKGYSWQRKNLAQVFFNTHYAKEERSPTHQHFLHNFSTMEANEIVPTCLLSNLNIAA